MDQSMTFISNPIMVDNSKELQLSESGYTIFSFLGDEDIKKLIDYYEAFQKGEPSHFYSSSHSSDIDFRKKTSNFIKETILPLLSLYLKNYRLLGGAFVIKPANGKGLLPPHQDWNLVDETKARSYNIWIPLTDVTFENGAVCVLPSSHRKIFTQRGPGIPSLFKEIEPLIWKRLKVLPMKAGEALLYDHALLHASPINTTAKIRLGIVCGIISKESKMQLYFDQLNSIGAYQIDENFFMEKDPLKGAEGLSFIKSLPKQEPVSIEKFNECFLNTKKKTSLFKRLFYRT